MDTKQLTKKQKHWLEDESGAWVEQGIIEPQQQARILGQYSTSHAENFYSSWSSLLLISLGAILIGGGVILLIAHNWEYFGKGTRTVLSILPLILAQALAWYSARYKPQVAGLREAAGILLFFAVAASIALISQTYHIYGDLESFLFTWLVLTIPVLYLLGSAGVLILICGVTLWLCGLEREPYWLLYLLLLPYLYGLYQQQRHILFQTALWFVVIGSSFSIIYSVRWNSPLDDWMVYIFLSLSVFYYCLGRWVFGFKEYGFWSNPLSSIGALSVGTISLALTTESLYRYSRLNPEVAYTFNDYLILLLLVISILGIVLFVWKNLAQMTITEWGVLASMVLAIWGLFGSQINIPEIPFIIFANLYVLTASIILMWQGINQHRLMLLNGGLLWFSFLVLFRFFDSDIPFALKGVVFILIGSAFLAVNIWYNKKMKQQPAQEEVA
ncbi:DUF2157 domain-containing protein [Kangiella sp.]|uniref:DUF2157 domain-containing protein n=1 Tax=Kangiella sp. TaxID=1920245 RepID=UPI001983E0DE|nr:DUF2157 domain-containing protein [Kangiella sp.]MBD3652956.1 DUF2157 domain-containing protein [Kangiella sp.]